MVFTYECWTVRGTQLEDVKSRRCYFFSFWSAKPINVIRLAYATQFSSIIVVRCVTRHNFPQHHSVIRRRGWWAWVVPASHTIFIDDTCYAYTRDRVPCERYEAKRAICNVLPFERNTHTCDSRCFKHTSINHEPIRCPNHARHCTTIGIAGNVVLSWRAFFGCDWEAMRGEALCTWILQMPVKITSVPSTQTHTHTAEYYCVCVFVWVWCSKISFSFVVLFTKIQQSKTHCRCDFANKERKPTKYSTNNNAVDAKRVA